MIAFIPCRSGSKSIPDKNIKLLGGIPLIVWSIQAAQACGLETWVSSDSEKYLEIARQHGAKTLLRPSHLASDTSTTYEVLLYEISRIEQKPKEIAIFQPTAPFRKKSNIEEAIRVLHDGNFDSVVSVVKVPDRWHPDEALHVSDGQVRMASGAPISQRKTRRQDYTPYFVPSGTLYLLKSENLEKGNLYGDKVCIAEEKETVNINSWDDWDRATEIAKTWEL